MSTKIILTTIPFEQPAGEFLLSLMKIQDLIRISEQIQGNSIRFQ